MNTLAAFPFIALLTGVLLQLILAPVLKPVAKGRLAFLSGLAALLGTLAFIPSTANGQALETTLFTWDQDLTLLFHVDGLSVVFCLMATGIGSAILLYCIRYMEHEPEGTTRFYALMLTFISGLVSLVCSANLLMAYFSWEVIGLCSYFLVGFWYKNSAAARGARKVLIMTHLPGYGLLIAILLLYNSSGTFLWTDPALATAFGAGTFVLMLAAAMAKSVMFPLHTWIPEAMNAPTPVSALLHSACYVKAGVYLIARMVALTPWPASWHTLVLAIGCATMLVGALFALVQTDLKRLLAFSTISQLGYIVTGFGLGTDLGIAAGLFYCLSHGLFKGTLFLCAGAIQHATGTRDMEKLGGLASVMPHTARIWLVVAASIIGVPLLNGFVAKWLLYDAALEANMLPVVLVGWFVSILTTFYILKATVSVFYGQLPADLQERPVHDAAPSMRVGMGALATLCLVFGIAPQLLMTPVVAPAVRAMGFDWVLSLSWLGVRSASAGAQVTLGALLALVALLAGWLIYRLGRTASTGEQVMVFTGGEPLPAGTNQVGATDFAALAETTFRPVYRVADPDPFYLALWRTIRRGAERIDHLVSEPTLARSLASSLILALLVLVAVWIV